MYNKIEFLWISPEMYLYHFYSIYWMHESYGRMEHGDKSSNNNFWVIFIYRTADNKCANKNQQNIVFKWAKRKTKQKVDFEMGMKVIKTTKILAHANTASQIESNVFVIFILITTSNIIQFICRVRARICLINFRCAKTPFLVFVAVVHLHVAGD